MLPTAIFTAIVSGSKLGLNSKEFKKYRCMYFNYCLTLKKSHDGNIPYDLHQNENFRNYSCFHPGITLAVGWE